MTRGREFFRTGSPGAQPEPEVPQAVSWFEDEALAEIIEEKKFAKKRATECVPECRYVPEFEKFDKELEALDFDLLRTIFEEIALKCGVEKGTMNFVNKERMVSYGLMGCNAAYDPRKNIIDIDYSYYIQIAKKLKIDLSLAIVPAICHEEGHAAVRTECHGVIHDNPKAKIKSGFGQVEYAPFKHLFSLLDEGVNEKMSREIALEYLKRDYKLAESTGEEQIKKLIEVIKKGDGDGMNYVEPVKFVGAIVEKIADKIGIQKDVVWKAFIRSRFEGENFEDPELRDMFAEVFSPDFLDKLATADTDKKLEELLKTF